MQEISAIPHGAAAAPRSEPIYAGKRSVQLSSQRLGSSFETRERNNDAPVAVSGQNPLIGPNGH